jgi:homoserine O-acetyltransferase
MIAIPDDETREAVARSLQRIAHQDARRYVQLPDPIHLWRGGKLHGARIAYECWGELNEARDNAILLFTGLSPPAHAKSSGVHPAEGWWERMIGPGLAIDTSRFFVLCVNSLGSCFGSTGPRSINPAIGEPYRLGFPELSVEDIAHGGYEVQCALGIERLYAVIGPSLGGMVVLAFAAQFPGAARRLISISGTTAASAFAIALRSIQREAVRSDALWQGGQYSFDRPPTAGLRLARKLGTVTYRSAAELNERFGRAPVSSSMRHAEPFAPEFSVEHYLDRQAERFVSTFDANCYLYLSRAMDRFNLAEHGDGIAEVALDRSALELALVIGVESDMLFTIGEQYAVAQALRAAGTPTRFASLPCPQGHDSFLIEIEPFGSEIRQFLELL